MDSLYITCRCSIYSCNYRPDEYLVSTAHQVFFLTILVKKIEVDKDLIKLLNHAYASNAVSFLIKKWREGPDCSYTRDYCEEAARDATLARYAMVFCKFTGAIIHAASLHECDGSFNRKRFYDSLTCRGVYSIVSKHGSKS